MKITSLTQTGMGRAEDGSLVPRVLPGEEVELTDAGPRILTPSADRVAAPCRHFKSCGGCVVQHGSDPFVSSWKRGILATALAAQGINAEIAGVETSPPNSRRRAKFAGRRTKKGAIVGFHGWRSGDVVSVPECMVLNPKLTALLSLLERMTRLAASRTVDAAYQVTDSITGIDLAITSPHDLSDALRAEVPGLCEGEGVARVSWNDEPLAMFEPPAIQIGTARVVPPPGAFLQATPQGEAALANEVEAIVAGADRVVDLFAGCGTFALRLAARSEVHAVEGDERLLAALDAGWRGVEGVRTVTTETRDLFRRPLLPDELNRFGAIILDPPRAGADAQIHEIAGSTVETVAMVSCNPVTFARDAKALVSAGFSMDPVTIVDQFRWSAHLELVAAFRRS